MTEFEKTIAYYEESSEEDWRLVGKLFSEKEYGYCLFFCHLALEKLIKGVLVKHTNEPAPYSHDLSFLAKRAGIILTPDTVMELNTITTFNIAGRYDDEKREFRKKSTKEYTEKYVDQTKNLILWLKENYLKK